VGTGSGTCTCSATGQKCSANGDCCAGLTCQANKTCA
jgi:hypothetical protein